jgi:guanosine-3',5'-bis(diphosphate) 3'-pyrophosphohydrolase
MEIEEPSTLSALPISSMKDTNPVDIHNCNKMAITRNGYLRRLIIVALLGWAVFTYLAWEHVTMTSCICIGTLLLSLYDYTSTVQYYVITLLEGIVFAAEKHKYQRRKDGKGPKGESASYIVHPLRVMLRIARTGGLTWDGEDVHILLAAVLHDTIEDTATTYEELRLFFGKKVADLVKEVSDDKSLPQAERKQHQIDHAKHLSREAKIIKLADKIDNLHDLQRNTPVGWSEERVAESFVWSNKVTSQMRGIVPEFDQELDEIMASSSSSKEDEEDDDMPSLESAEDRMSPECRVRFASLEKEE